MIFCGLCLCLSAGHAIISPGLSGFSSSAGFVSQLLTRADIFLIWNVILLVIGFAIADGLSRGKSSDWGPGCHRAGASCAGRVGALSSGFGGLAVQRPFFLDMPKPFIQVKGLTKHYQMGGTTVRALDGLNLDIDAHTFTVVMGPSGSGKSTLLYLLGGLDRATSGEISVDGARLDEMDENALALFRRQTMGFRFSVF